ncbi:MAG: dihydrofolate reductase [Alphaproteobacteria bacterium]|nr:dihydrofolate reductase [Alphaproteobacteria bacterium]
MTIVAIWCRHTGDNVIGIGQNIPWHISSDFKRFRRITEGGIVLAGERTYESFPNKTLPNRKIYVLTFNPAYEVSDKENHFVITDADALKNESKTIYLSGGASVYKLFMTGAVELMPDVVVDCVYQGDLNANLKGQKVDITPCVDVLKEKYEQISKDYLEDNITTRVLVKKGDFVDQSVIKHILSAIENEGENK